MTQNERQRAKEQKFTAAYVRSILNYNPETGIFTWRAMKGGKFPGTRAGSFGPRGYCNLRFDNCRFRAQRIAWLIQTGEWPEHKVDHIDRDKGNNRWYNLRHCTQAQNLWNAIRQRRFTGITSLGHGQFKAAIMRNGIKYQLGEFFCAEKAHEAYLRASKELSGEFCPY